MFLRILCCALALAAPLSAQQRRRPASKKAAPAKPAPVKPIPPNADPQKLLASMSLRDKAAQMVIVSSYGDDPKPGTRPYLNYQRWVRDLHVGGIIVINRVVGGVAINAGPKPMLTFLNRMQKLSSVPLIVGADFERGASMRVSGTAQYPPLMAIAATNNLYFTRYLGAATAREARALGVHWIYVPDADVNSNAANPVINIRSFGEDPKSVTTQVLAFLEGARSDPKYKVLTCVKHFPGHGDTSVDSHYGLPRLDATRERIESLELAPFRAAIAAGVDAVMSAHISVPALDPSNVPATVSEPIMTGLLRKQLGFGGLISTDAMNMAGLARQFLADEAAVRSVEAGVDILLIPANPDAAIAGVVKAVQSGRLTEARLDQSVLRILEAKKGLGLFEQRIADPANLAKELGATPDLLQAQLMADRAVTQYKNDGTAFPVKDRKTACYYALIENRRGTLGKRFVEELKTYAPGAKTYFLNAESKDAEFDDAKAAAAGCESIVVAAYRGNLPLNDKHVQLVKALMAAGKPIAVMALGNPYLLSDFASANALITTYSSAPTSELAAIKALFGELEVQGKQVVTIPGLTGPSQ